MKRVILTKTDTACMYSLHEQKLIKINENSEKMWFTLVIGTPFLVKSFTLDASFIQHDNTN